VLFRSNDYHAKLFGYTREECIGRSTLPGDLGFWVDKEDRDRHIAWLKEHGEAIGFEAPMRRKDGSTFIGQLSSSTLEIEGETYNLTITRDITERKLAEEALRQSQESFASLFEHAVLGLYRTSLDGRILMANQAVCDMFGYASFTELARCHLDENPSYPVREFRKELVAKSRIDGFESIWTKPSGETVMLRESARMVRDPSGAPMYFEGVVEDVTERKRVEEEKARLLAQLLQAQKMESLGILAGGVAHDMNNVLGAILVTASSHREAQPLGGPTHRAFDTIANAAVRGGKMVKSLLSLARQNPAEERQLDVNALLLEQVHLLERTTLSKVRLVRELATDLRPIRGDANALIHAFMNLCVNAVDAMPENGTLTLRTRNVDEHWIEVRVEDMGTGMPREVLERAMDPFFTTKEMGKGTGLGLSMVYTTVKAHQGQMELLSEPGRGTQVVLRFPVSTSSSQFAEPAAGERPEPTWGRLELLLVDDDELIQTAMQAIPGTSGLRITTVSSGEEALVTLATGFRPDVVILDMNMPGLGGAGTLPRLRALCPDVPVLLATGRADQDALDLVARHPSVTLLPKPFSMGELQQLLESLRRA